MDPWRWRKPVAMAEGSRSLVVRSHKRSACAFKSAYATGSTIATGSLPIPTPYTYPYSHLRDDPAIDYSPAIVCHHCASRRWWSSSAD